MILFTFLLSPAARVWNLRILLLWTIAVIYLRIKHADGLMDSMALGITGARLVQWPFQGSALVDLSFVLLEIAATTYAPFLFGYTGNALQSGLDVLPLLPPLILSVLFRVATIKKSAEPVLRQRVIFLGSCAPTHPPYTLLSILLNRSIARPLVRSEARYIILVRAFIISLIVIGVPAFAIYSIIITPLATQIYTRDLIVAVPWSLDSAPGNVTILLSPLGLAPKDTSDSTSYDIQMHVGTLGGVFECKSDSTATDATVLSLDCTSPTLLTRASLKLTLFTGGPWMWENIENITISLSIPPDAAGVYVTPAQGMLHREWKEATWNSPAVPLLPGSNLFGVLTWTRRELIPRAAIWGTSSRTTVYTPDVTGLQTTGFTSSSRVATLTLLQQSPWPTRLLQETLDSTALTGIATFGGFWTFLDGAFALFFGANVLYFMFGRRPLSALGVVHMFQHRRLVRQWHEDFPAIHTEGGQPGSESAGIVAFIRERLVDLGEDPRVNEGQSDVEAPTSRAQQAKEADDSASIPVLRKSDGSRSYSKYAEGPGYMQDKTPLLDADLGVDDISYDDDSP
ncbi:hypothetical protein B0H19DRAFT_1239252 [Mycena capillaripes]|nr:hypothetical protein B0H19DRAFT_1239252 [Mycena capillaripes]